MNWLKQSVLPRKNQDIGLQHVQGKVLISPCQILLCLWHIFSMVFSSSVATPKVGGCLFSFTLSNDIKNSINLLFKFPKQRRQYGHWLDFFVIFYGKVADIVMSPISFVCEMFQCIQAVSSLQMQVIPSSLVIQNMCKHYI